MDVPVRIEARTFINPWGHEMPDTYLVTLSTTAGHADRLHAILANLNDGRWRDAHASAQTETTGDFCIPEVAEKRYLISARDYQTFKQAVRAAKAAYIAQL